jgi:hypothetical protein
MDVDLIVGADPENGPVSGPWPPCQTTPCASSSPELDKFTVIRVADEFVVDLMKPLAARRRVKDQPWHCPDASHFQIAGCLGV